MKLTMPSLLKKLRKYNFRQYAQFLFCVTFSVLLVTSYAVMLYSTLVQRTFPEGGDSRKQIWMIFAVALLGCLIFIMYSTSLFLKYKSRETGVFLALGAKKSYLAKQLTNEILRLMGSCILMGIIGGIGIALLIWQLCKLFLKDLESMVFGFTLNGVFIGIAFGMSALVLVLIQVILFAKRTDVMEILYHHQKNEPLKMVNKRNGVFGVLMLFSGLFLGFVVPMIAGTVFNRNLSGIWSVTYLLSLVGIYRIMTYMIMKNKPGKNPQHYYNRLISSSMMKFQGRQMVRNMSITVLLLAAAMFSSFYAPQLSTANQPVLKSPVDYGLHYPATEDEIDKKDLNHLAKEYGVTISDYREIVFSELLASGVERDWTDDGKLIETHVEDYQLADFIDSTTFNKQTNNQVSLNQGQYYKVNFTEQAESFYEKNDDLDQVTNPLTKQKLKLRFKGTIECQELTNNGNQRYILNDSDYQMIRAGLSKEYQNQQILFNVSDLEASYPFAKAVYKQFVDQASKKMAVSKEYDRYQHAKALAENRQANGLSSMNLSEESRDLMEYWKYYPTIKIIYQKEFVRNTFVFFLVFIYVAVICLAAVGVILYTRSATMGIMNKQLFDDLKRLGANNQYIKQCITRQLNMIFIVPAVVATVLISVFTGLMFWMNDNQLSSSEISAAKMDVAIVLMIAAFLGIIYYASMRKIKQILDI
ncbi:ABC transporter permease [Enterococcus florum]|uniref:ABC transporter permease n=1 Tax=Enterococcus florum TaxID=2480627 RepID=A0A4P5P8X6_9ENTE|nr:FtsX-like permease family protein [Enterococcus florum]GCF93996.1 ABC transporter permease [Enterococcus florum]